MQIEKSQTKKGKQTKGKQTKGKQTKGKQIKERFMASEHPRWFSVMTQVCSDFRQVSSLATGLCKRMSRK